MALSEYEKQVLADMERHLRQQDPDLADTMAASLPQTPAEDEPVSASPLSPRRIALGSILAAVGLAVVLVGVTISAAVWTIVLGVVGFLMMLGGVLYALSSPRNVPSASTSPAGSLGQARPSREEREAQRRARWQNRG